jgi:hypothetical protein
MVALTLSCLIVTVVSLKLIRPSQDIEVINAKYIPTDLMNYTLPYIVSFMSIEYSDTGKFVGFVVSWRMYEVEYRFPGGQEKYTGKALAHGHLTTGAFKQSMVQSIQIIKP